MRKLLLIIVAATAGFTGFSQTTVAKKKLSNRAADHLMIQLAANSWMGEADSVSSHEKGLNRSANVYLMVDKQFKSSPKMSVGFGVGIGNSDIYFSKMNVGITSISSTVPFTATDTTNRFKKYKLSESFLEIPVELRFMSKPSQPNQSLKLAIGIKAGTLLNAHTKGKVLENSAGTKLNDYTVKESSKAFFNTTRIAATARVGYGIFSVFGSYGLTNVFKDGVAPATKLLQVGLSISGL